jgi:phage tail-like protein
VSTSYSLGADPVGPGARSLFSGGYLPSAEDDGEVHDLGGDARPRAVSDGRRLREALPAIYQEAADSLLMRFVKVLEEALDVPVAILDHLDAYIDPEVAPEPMLRALVGWLGIVESLPLHVARGAVVAGRSGQGTRAALQTQLRYAVPAAHFEVVEAIAPSCDAISLLVTCDEPLDDAALGLVRWCIEDHYPAHLAYRVRVPAAQEAEA